MSKEKEKPVLTHAQRKRAEKKRRKIIYSVLAVVAIVLLVLSAVLILNVTEDDNDNNDENGSDESTDVSGLVDPYGREDTEDEAEIGDTVFDDDNYNPIDLPVEKPDYARHDESLIRQGLNDYNIRCYEQNYIIEDPETGEVVEDPVNQELLASDEYCQYGGSIDVEVDPETGEAINTPSEPEDSLEDLNTSGEVRSLLENSAADQIEYLGQHFSSRNAGFTNDPNRAFDEDGNRNWNYSFVLAEDIEFFFSHHVERLINPYYGGWSDYQHASSAASENFALSSFRDLFYSGWWNENIGRDLNTANRDNMPVFADWDGDDYRQVLDANGYEDVDLIEDNVRWVGEINDYDLGYRETHDGLSFEIRAVMDMTYHSYTTTGSTVSLPASLEIVIAPNTANPDRINQRLVVAHAEHSVGN